MLIDCLIHYIPGVVEFKDVSLRYDKSLPFVLHDVNFKTKSCEKIGIVGRTGAGKSSIIQVNHVLIANYH